MMKKHLGWLSEGRNLFTVTTENLSHVTRVITELQNECPNMKEREELKDFSMALALFCHNLVKLRLNTVELQVGVILKDYSLTPLRTTLFYRMQPINVNHYAFSLP